MIQKPEGGSLRFPAMPWKTLSITAWSALVLILGIRNILNPERLSGFAPYLRAASRWVEGLAIYSSTPNKGFVYSPFAAVCYLPFAFMQPYVGSILWRALSVGILVAGASCLLRSGTYAHIPDRLRGLVYLLIFPLALSNVDAGQANPLLIGMIMIALAAASAGRWTVAAIAMAGAFYWKIYPLAAALLLILVAPGKFTWRFLFALIGMALIPFLFQEPAYVVKQYGQWFATRAGDNRLQYPIEIAPLDLWYVLVRMGGLPLPETAYRVLQAASGAAIAGFCLFGKWRNWPQDRLLGGLFAFVSIWMVLLGPSTESFTYLLLAPAVAIGVTECFALRYGTGLRALAVLSWVLLMLAVVRVGFVPHMRSGMLLALQPIGALVFLGFALKRYLDPELWKTAGE